MNERELRTLSCTLANMAARKHANLNDFEDFAESVHETYLELVNKKPLSPDSIETLENLFDDIDMQGLYTDR